MAFFRRWDAHMKPELQGRNALVDTVLRYVKACNAGDLDLMISTFSTDVAAYFIDRPPIRGNMSLAQFWKTVHMATRARWTVDRAIAAGQEVVIEWSQRWMSPDTGEERLSRGIDWFFFVAGQIAEIHQYYRPERLAPDQTYELQGFPYRERGFPSWEDLDSRLP